VEFYSFDILIDMSKLTVNNLQTLANELAKTAGDKTAVAGAMLGYITADWGWVSEDIVTQAIAKVFSGHPARVLAGVGAYQLSKK
jgi:hypothetical protein